MDNCSICGNKQNQTGVLDIVSIESGKVLMSMPDYNIDLLTVIKGQQICNRCMYIYNKINYLYCT